VEKPRPFPRYPDIIYVDNGAAHDYHAVTIEAERRFSRGLFFQLAYTRARDLGTDSGTIENPFDLAREWGHDRATPTHRLTSAVMYELPFGHDRKWLNRAPRLVDLALGGWQISAIGYQQTGVWLTPTMRIPDPTGTRFTSGANRPLVTIRPNQLRDSALSNPTIEGWFDPSAFAAPALGQFGTAARGAFEGPGLNVWHAGIHKIFRPSATAPLFRVDLTTTNVLNQPQWGNPNVP
jgi:hypothetical protein